jgi:hypothetical protein
MASVTESLDDSDLAPGVPDGRSVSARAAGRSPTLLAGRSAASQGPVRIWSPQQRPLLAAFLASSPIYGFGAYDGLYLHTGLGASLVLIWFMALISQMATMPAAQYFTTDSLGIGVTTRRGSRAVRWADIEGVGRLYPNDSTVYRLRLRETEAIELRLNGYSAQVRQQFLETIRRNIA